MKTDAKARDRRNGQYAAEMDAVCVCGHFSHTEVIGGRSDCLGSDFGECEGYCPCPKYRKSRKRRA